MYKNINGKKIEMNEDDLQELANLQNETLNLVNNINFLKQMANNRPGA